MRWRVPGAKGVKGLVGEGRRDDQATIDSSGDESLRPDQSSCTPAPPGVHSREAQASARPWREEGCEGGRGGEAAEGCWVQGAGWEEGGEAWASGRGMGRGGVAHLRVLTSLHPLTVNLARAHGMPGASSSKWQWALPEPDLGS